MSSICNSSAGPERMRHTTPLPPFLRGILKVSLKGAVLYASRELLPQFKHESFNPLPIALTVKIAETTAIPTSSIAHQTLSV